MAAFTKILFKDITNADYRWTKNIVVSYEVAKDQAIDKMNGLIINNQEYN